MVRETHSLRSGAVSVSPPTLKYSRCAICRHCEINNVLVGGAHTHGFLKTQLLELFVPCFFLKTCYSDGNNRDEQVLQVLFMRHLLSPIALPHPCLKQSRGYNLSDVALTLISPSRKKTKQKTANNSKQTQIREGNIYLAF